MKILIGVPCMETLPVEYVNSLLRLKKPEGTEILHVPLSLVYVARDMIIDYAINNNFTHVMFIDSDMVFQSDLLTSLLKHNKDIISALAFQRKPPYNPCLYKELKIGEAGENIANPWKDYPNGLTEVGGCGMACCLIKVDVFKKIREKSQCFFPIRGMGEDLAFCIRARQAGYKIFADTSLKVGHLGSIVCGEDTFQAWNGVSE